MKVVILVYSLLIVYSECAKILGVFPAPGYSQFILGGKLMEELANRGHEVTMLSPYTPNHDIQNYRTIQLKEILTDIDQLSPGIFTDRYSWYAGMKETYNLGLMISEVTLKNRQVQELIHSNATFDLVLVEQFYCESLMGFSTHFGAPLALFSSIGPSEWSNHLMGNPSIPSISPIAHAPFSRHMTFIQRAENLMATFVDYGYKTLIAYPQHEQFLRKFFPTPINFNQLLYNSSLMLLNSHVTTSENAPLIHGMVPIGGFHITNKKLSEEIQQFLDSAHDGAILFSLGTNVKSSDLPKGALAGIIRVFSKLKQKVVWKFEEELEEKPKNVLIAKWLSQSDILAHPNVQLFITHGGLLSITEAVFFGVPLIGVPIFGDQHMNMARASRLGYAKTLQLRDLSEETLGNAIKEATNNPSFQAKAAFLSNTLRDSIVRPLDLAMYSLEYVIRHKGAHLKPPSVDLYWYQLYMLDIFGALALLLLVLYVVVNRIARIKNHKNKNVSKVVQKNNNKTNKKKKQ